MKENDLFKEEESFQKQKIKQLNIFFMKLVIRSIISAFSFFVASIFLLVLIIKISDLDPALKISLVSMVSTYVLTISKIIIDKILSIISFLIKLLSEEQRGFSKNIGIEIDEVDFKNSYDEKRKTN